MRSSAEFIATISTVNPEIYRMYKLYLNMHNTRTKFHLRQLLELYGQNTKRQCQTYHGCLFTASLKTAICKHCRKYKALYTVRYFVSGRVCVFVCECVCECVSECMSACVSVCENVYVSVSECVSVCVNV
jgi:hypothetical protein